MSLDIFVDIVSDKVRELARASGAPYAQYSVFISVLWEYCHEDEFFTRLSELEFKRLLLRAHAAGRLELVPARRQSERARASAVQYRGQTLHRISVPATGEDWRGKWRW